MLPFLPTWSIFPGLPNKPIHFYDLLEYLPKSALSENYEELREVERQYYELNCLSIVTHAAVCVISLLLLGADIFQNGLGNQFVFLPVSIYLLGYLSFLNEAPKYQQKARALYRLRADSSQI